MAINLTTLFTNLGVLAGMLKNAHEYAGNTIQNGVDDLVATLTDYPPVVGAVVGSAESYKLNASSTLGAGVRDQFKAYLRYVVNSDNQQADKSSDSLAVAELVRQMVSQSYKVAAPALTATLAAVSGNTGTGTVVVTTKRGDGRTEDNLMNEAGYLSCTADAQNGTGTSGSEPWNYRGDEASDVLGYDYGIGSGANTGLTTIDSQAAGGLSLLANGNLDTFTVANTPDNWTIGAGAAGTDIFSEGTNKYRGASAVKFLGTGAARPILRQTLTTLKPNRVYAVNCFLRSGGALTTAANFKVTLVDVSNAVINDDQGAANGISVALTGLTTTYVAKNGVLITPKVLPSVVKIQIEASNGANLVAAEAVYLDEISMSETVPLYTGGPRMAIFAGATPWMTGDAYTLTTTNDHNGKDWGASWNRVFDRFLSMRSLGLLLPTSGTTLVNDVLISAG